MHSSNRYEAERAGAYLAALEQVELQPGDKAQLVCPECAAPFVIELPLSGEVDRLPRVVGSKLFVTCSNHCLTNTTFEQFAPRLIDVPPPEMAENSHCSRYWTDTPSARCPLCGIENYRKTLQVSVEAIRSANATTEQVDLVRLAKDLVATFDGVMRAMVRGHDANLREMVSSGQNDGNSVGPNATDVTPAEGIALADYVARWPGSISFQSLPGARKNLLQATCSCDQWHRGNAVEDCTTGSDIERWVTGEIDATAWSDTCRVFQKRHLYQHALGAADDNYLSNTGDQTVRVGQMVPVGHAELLTASEVCTVISSRFFGLYLS